jgi:predicted small metal-binding protein
MATPKTDLTPKTDVIIGSLAELADMAKREAELVAQLVDIRKRHGVVTTFDQELARSIRSQINDLVSILANDLRDIFPG